MYKQARKTLADTDTGDRHLCGDGSLIRPAVTGPEIVWAILAVIAGSVLVTLLKPSKPPDCQSIHFEARDFYDR